MSERDEFEAPYVIDRSHPNQAYVTLGFSSVEACTQFIKATRYGHNDPTISPTRATPQQAMPEGWKLVPVEPTESMRLAPAKDRPGFSRNVAAEIYRSMLAAAPQPSQEPEKAVEPAHEHYWGYFTDTKTYQCRCGAEQAQYPFGPADYKD